MVLACCVFWFFLCDLHLLVIDEDFHARCLTVRTRCFKNDDDNS